MTTPQYLSKAQQWSLNPYFDKIDREEIKGLIKNQDFQELEERFYQELEFGTGGLRNIMGFGSNRINKYTIRKASYAMAKVIVEEFPNREHLVCIAYDCRNNSEFFAKESAKVFTSYGIRVKLFSELVPVPILAYSIKFFKACAGVMITASHNPGKYNGFKAYWETASQVTPPIDQKIITTYNEIKDWNSLKKEENNRLIELCGKDIFSSYFNMLSANISQPSLVKEKAKDLKIIYTPLHGTGGKFIKKIALDLGFENFKIVPEQEEPNGDFPTVEDPNPEYPKALTMASNLLLKSSFDIALGSDPDTDRLGVAYRVGKEVKFLTGNQIGILLLEYKLKSLAQNHKMPSSPLVIKTIVTSELQAEIAKAYHVKIENTLTGFKWMGQKIKELEEENKEFKFLFGNEESYGYLGHDSIRDKDGISAFLMMVECALYHKNQGRTLDKALDKIYHQYGYFADGLLNLYYEGREGKSIMNQFMEKFRSPKTTSFLDMKIQEKEDLLDHPNFPKSNVLGLHFENGHRLWMRPSGTEPKIKFYSMFIDKKFTNLEESKKNGDIFIAKIESELKRISKELQ